MIMILRALLGIVIGGGIGFAVGYFARTCGAQG
jgi:hypothetical protein